MAIKILILTDNFPPSLGGVERHTYTLACYLSKLSHDVVGVTRSSKDIYQTSQLDRYLEGVRKIKVLRILPMATSLPLYNTTKYLPFSRSIVKYLNEVVTNMTLYTTMERINFFRFYWKVNFTKNPEIILKALAELNDVPVKMYVVGDGPLSNQLKDKVCKLGIQNKVHFFGSIPERRKLELLQEIDIFLMPSLEEGCPIALLEAVAAGKAIIASDIPAIREVIENGEEGLLFNPYDVQQLAAHILTLYNNVTLRKNLKKRPQKG